MPATPGARPMSSYQIPSAASSSPVASPLAGDRMARALGLGALILTMVWLTAWIWPLVSPLGFNDDAAQTLSTAAQWQKGQGLTTTLLYYDSQLDQKAPAAQTVWPPALPVLTSVVSDLTGLSLPNALVAVLLISHLVTAVVLGLIVSMALQTGKSQSAWPDGIGVTAALFWLTLAPALLGVVRGLSEPLFVAWATLSMLMLLRAVPAHETPTWQKAAAPQWPWLMAASAGVAAALLTRYQAVALIVPLGLAAALAGAPGTALAQRMRSFMLVCSFPALVLALMFWRNWSVTGLLTGGAEPASGQSLTEIAARLSWVPVEWQQLALAGLLASMLAAGLGALVVWVRGFNSCRSAPAKMSRRARVGMVFCLSGYASNLALMVLLALISTAYAIELRYLLLNMLMLVLPGVLALDQLRHHRRVRRLAMPPTALVTLGCLVLALQLLAFKPVIEDRLASTPPVQLAEVLSTTLIGAGGAQTDRSVLTWLAQQPAPARLLSSNAQSLALVLRAYEIPVDTIVGIPLRIYSGRRWNDERIRALARRHAVDTVMAFRIIPTWVFEDPLDTWLTGHGKDLPWLEPINATPALFLGKIR
ncbi:MAG: hypothetical protein AB8C46_18645 [Burkholderiaceae bacterium]